MSDVTIVSARTIRLQARARDKTDAIRQVGELLVAGGCVDPAYVDGMLARERITSTYLGNGVAIPHGQNENRSQVRRTGIAVLQLPEGVEWEPNELAYLVIGIAANDDDHVDVLTNLAELIEDPATAEQLARTTDPLLIAGLLNGTRA